MNTLIETRTITPRHCLEHEHEHRSSKSHNIRELWPALRWKSTVCINNYLIVVKGPKDLTFSKLLATTL